MRMAAVGLRKPAQRVNAATAMSERQQRGDREGIAWRQQRGREWRRTRSGREEQRSRANEKDASLLQSLLHPLERRTLPLSMIPLAVCSQSHINKLRERGEQ